MKMTPEQIAVLAPKAAYIRVNGCMYRMNWVDEPADPPVPVKERVMQFSDPDDGVEFERSFGVLAKGDLIFYRLTKLTLPTTVPA